MSLDEVDESSLLDPRPLLSIAFVTGNLRAALPGVLETATGAQHRYKVLKQDDDGFDRTDVTMLWVPMAPDPLAWVGVVGARESSRSDGRVIVVLTKTKGVRASELDAVEREIREHLADLGASADDYLVVHEARTASKRDGTPGSSTVIEALNTFGRVQNTAFDDPLLAGVNYPTLFVRRTKPPGSDLQVKVGTAHVGDAVNVLGPRVGAPMIKASIQALHAYRPGRPGAWEPVDQISRFEEGSITLSDGVVADIGSRLMAADLPIATTVRLRVSWPWSPRTRFKKVLPRKGALLPTYVPGGARPVPAKALSVTPEEDGFVVDLAGVGRQPVFSGRWMIVDHATPRVYSAELIEILG